MNSLSHTDQEGKARMVDVGGKAVQKRTAVAEGFIAMQDPTAALIADNQIKKGDVLTVAEIAGIQAAKRTSELIPLCHPLQISKVAIETRLLQDPAQSGVKVRATVICNGRTGVEMEALTAASVCLLTIYDMCKAVDKQMLIGQLSLVSKTKE